MSGVSERAIRLFAYILYIKHYNLDREEVLEQIHLHKHRSRSKMQQIQIQAPWIEGEVSISRASKQVS